MKYKTLFRMLIKAVGVLVIAQGLGGLGQGVAQVVAMLAQSRGVSSQFGYLQVVYLVAPTTQIVIGAYLFFAGRWVIDKAIPGNRPYCNECGYDLTGAQDNRCSECGTPFNPKDVMPAHATAPDTAAEHKQGFTL